MTANMTQKHVFHRTIKQNIAIESIERPRRVELSRRCEAHTTDVGSTMPPEVSRALGSEVRREPYATQRDAPARLSRENKLYAPRARDERRNREIPALSAAYLKRSRPEALADADARRCHDVCTWYARASVYIHVAQMPQNPALESRSSTEVLR